MEGLVHKRAGEFGSTVPSMRNPVLQNSGFPCRNTAMNLTDMNASLHLLISVHQVRYLQAAETNSSMTQDVQCWDTDIKNVMTRHDVSFRQDVNEISNTAKFKRKLQSSMRPS